MLLICVHNPLAEFFPLPPEEIESVCLCVVVEAAVLDTPFNELTPAVHTHDGRPNHDLVEFVVHIGSAAER